MLLLTTCARLLTAGAALALAYYFGTSATMDQYSAFTIVTTALPALFASALPVLVARHVTGHSNRIVAVTQCRRWGRKFAMIASVVYLLCIIPLGWALSPVKAWTAMQPLLLMLLIGLPSLATASLISVEQTLLQTKGKLYVASACQSVSAAVALLAACASGTVGGLMLCAAGVSVGGVLEYLVLRRQGEPNVPLTEQAPPVGTPLKSVLALASSGGAALIGGFLDQSFLASMGHSAQATWSFASRVPSFITLTLFTVVGVMTTAILPRLHLRSRSALWDGAVKLYATVVGVTVVVLAAVSLFAQPMVQLLFERGAFGPADTVRVAALMGWMFLAYLLFPASGVLTRAVGVVGGNRALLISAGVFLGVRTAIASTSYTHLGAPGLVVATSAASICQSAMLFWWLRTYCKAQ